jgi:acyl carrier protein
VYGLTGRWPRAARPAGQPAGDRSGWAEAEPGMTMGSAAVGLTEQWLLAELIGMLADVTGEDERWAARITPASRIEADLSLDSVEFAALGARLRGRYGDRVDLAAVLAGLDIDQVIGLTVGDLVGYLAGRHGLLGPCGAGA